MNEKMTFSPYIFPFIFLNLTGWGGLFFLVTATRPTLWPRWTLFFLIVVAVAGIALPLFYIANRLLFRKRYIKPEIISREATYTGVYTALVTWLNVGRVLDLSIVILLAVGFILIEYLIRLRERDEQPTNEPA